MLDKDMSENNTPLIGTPVNLTVYAVDYEYKKPVRTSKLPKSAKKEEENVGPNTLIVCSSDPSGQDLFGIVRRLVLGANPYDGSDFRILKSQRVFDVMGIAQTTTWDKLEGKAVEKFGVVVLDEEDDDGKEGGEPPVSDLN